MLSIKRLSSDEAKILIEGAEEKSSEIGVPMCIAVVDESGNLVAFTRMDGAKISSISIAIDKAFTGAAARKGTKKKAACAASTAARQHVAPLRRP